MGITIGILGIIIAFILLIFLVMKDFSPLYVGVLVTFVIIATNRLNLVETLTKVYLPGVASFVGGYFLMMLFGAIMGRLYDVSGAATSIARSLVKTFLGKNISDLSETQRSVTAVLLCCAAGGVLTYGGINNVVLMITMYPIAAAICKATDIPQRFAIGLAVSGTSSFAYGGPFTPQMPNIAAMNLMGTSSYAAMIPGLIAVAAEIVTMCFAFTWIIKKARKKGEHFQYGPNDTPWDDEAKLPNPWVSCIPLLVTFVTFNFLKLNITLAMFIGCALSVIIFYKPVSAKNKLATVINQGAVSSCSSLLFISAIVGFGAAVTSTEAYQVILAGLLGMNIHPYFQLILSIFVMSGISGSATAGVNLALPTLGPLFTGMGYPAAAIHRVASIACTVTDSLPSCGAIPMACGVAGNSLKDGYPGIFISTTLATFVGTIVVAVICILIPGIALV